MTDRPSPDDLPSYADSLVEAERQVRHYTYIEDTDMRWAPGGGPMNVVMANYTRLQAVERAVLELMETYRRASISDRDAAWNELRAALNGETP